MSRRLYRQYGRCAKCGYDATPAASTTYKAIHAFSGPVDEWLDRECLRCGYVWEEECSDAS